MTDQDALSPSESSMRELIHWIVVDILGGTNPKRALDAEHFPSKELVYNRLRVID
ncbi:phosphatidylethanolamine-binding protein [Medicago truncatula]|uniref:Phosphatidylethanolamine-binding protein n=1 Tax=Medicago truncatula TaxID=3880 RepID=G7KZ29_MEDTR|nr:phosphatidylethanolamine-binding protein [Medicago truncatula]